MVTIRDYIDKCDFVINTLVDEQKKVIIDNKECVKKSYPSFWEDFEMLGGKIDGGNL